MARAENVARKEALETKPRPQKKAAEASAAIAKVREAEHGRMQTYLKRMDEARGELAKLEAKQESQGLTDMKRRVVMEQMAEQERIIGSLANKLMDKHADDLDEKVARQVAREADEWNAKAKKDKADQAKGEHPLKGWKFKKENGVVKAHPPEEPAAKKAERVRAKMKSNPEMAEALAPGAKRLEKESVEEAFFEGKTAKTPLSDREARIEAQGKRVDRRMEIEDRVAELQTDLDRMEGELRKMGVDVHDLAVSGWAQLTVGIRETFNRQLGKVRAEYQVKLKELNKLGTELTEMTGLSKEAGERRKRTLEGIKARRRAS